MPSDRIRIAFIHQPLSDIRPPVSLTGVADSIGLITDEVARRLPQSHEVIEYCVFHRGQKVVEQFDGVEYRRVSKFFDRFSNRIMREIDRAGWRDTRRPFFTSELCSAIH